MEQIAFSVLDELLLMHKAATSKVSSRAKETVVTVYTLDENTFILKDQTTKREGTETTYYRGTMAQRNAKLKELQFDPNSSAWHTI